MKIPTFSYFFDLSYYLTPCMYMSLPSTQMVKSVELWQDLGVYGRVIT